MKSRLSATLIAISVATWSLGAGAGSASALPARHAAVAQPASEPAANDARLQAVRQMEARETAYEDITRIQVPAANGGLKWIVETERLDR